jgi:hypothetical protein
MDGGFDLAGYRWVDAGDALRADAEAFVRQRYASAFGADVQSFMPSLLVSVDATGAIRACAGTRDAKSGPLFLEQYLDEPVERVLRATFDERIDRADIAELGHLSGLGHGEGGGLIAPLLADLAARERRWLVFTATRGLRALFKRMGLNPVKLAPADPARLGAAADHWGDYYRHDPWVVAGPLRWAMGDRR